MSGKGLFCAVFMFRLESHVAASPLFSKNLAMCTPRKVLCCWANNCYLELIDEKQEIYMLYSIRNWNYFQMIIFVQQCAVHILQRQHKANKDDLTSFNDYYYFALTYLV